MKKIVINQCFGGFGLSDEACMLYAKLCGFELYSWIDNTSIKVYGSEKEAREKNAMLHYCTKPVKTEDEYDNLENSNDFYWSDHSIERDDVNLVKVVETLGKKASGRCAMLVVVNIPDDVEWEIIEFDGNEHVAEKHRKWN